MSLSGGDDVVARTRGLSCVGVGAANLRRDVIEVDRGTGHVDAARGQRVLQRLDEEQRRIHDRNRASDRRCAEGDRARDFELRLFEVATVVDGRFGSGRGGPGAVEDDETGSVFETDRGRSADRCSRRHHQRGNVLVVLQRADRSGVAVLQVVPRPACPEPLVVERLIVADDAAVDLADPGGRERADPLVEHVGCAIRTGIDRRIARAADDQVAPQHAVLDRPGRFERRRVAIVPAERLGGRRQRQDLHVRRRHHQLAGVVLEETVAGVERADLDAPDAPRCNRRPEDLRQVVAQLPHGGARRGRAMTWMFAGLVRGAGARAGRAPSGAIGWPRRAAVIT